MTNLCFRLGPLSIEQKVRNPSKRARQGKENGPATKPDEVKQNDLEESTNETTKNVSVVCHPLTFSSFRPFTSQNS